jgi:hypothetical protein
VRERGREHWAAGGRAGPRGEWAGEEMGRRWKKKTREGRWVTGLGREDGLGQLIRCVIVLTTLSERSRGGTGLQGYSPVLLG